MVMNQVASRPGPGSVGRRAGPLPVPGGLSLWHHLSDRLCSDSV